MARFKIEITGVVQGVGFRPFIYQLAVSHKLTGNVCNTSGSVEIEVEGPVSAIDGFIKDIPIKVPAAAVIKTLDSWEIPEVHDEKFLITKSKSREDEYQLLSPDLATCPECRKEIFDKADRRYGYAFTNCTNCGPRFTIIDDIPYDRPLTTMRGFKMCPKCQHEYEDPSDRRFHAQPNACPVCGPHLTLLDKDGNEIKDDPIKKGALLLKEGHILAIKGLGGFLLACNALDNAANQRLRERKHRPVKPFAVMMKDIETVKEYCHLDKDEEALLTSTAAPIVLLKLRKEKSLAELVAPGLSELGVMLPYTPLHHLLLQETDLPLVMTSGNITEEPIVSQNDEALKELSNIADFFIIHNRDISRRYDDSVTAVYAGTKRLIRRARGYAPFPVTLAEKTSQILACGSDLKNAFCLTRDNYAFVSQHIGDMENEKANTSYEKTIEDYKRIFRIDPKTVACDMHPNYYSANYGRDFAKEKGLKLIEVQHHHAHIASVMAEHGIKEKVLGVALDGTGYGTDGKIWGFEFLKAGLDGFDRLGHLEYMPLPGGDAAVKNPIRIGAAYLYKTLGKIPEDIPHRGEALAHARNQHYFYESETVRFRVEAFFRDAEWLPSEISVEPEVTDVFGGAVAPRLVVGDAETTPANGGIRSTVRETRLDGSLPCCIPSTWSPEIRCLSIPMEFPSQPT
ncbi:MAG: carbamoyltransferase HypF, partial [Dehalococcoidales bacterium]|nr:carbamoyltransferase HypF [Dehalococcoidales bacterium]